MPKYQDLLNHQHTTKERVVYVMGGSCQICNYNKCFKALELHHVNPEEKEISISGNLLNRKWEEVLTELRKCILLCANCHREFHAGIINLQLESSFDQEKAKEISTIIDKIKSKQIFFCLDCGIEIKENRKRCNSCNEISRKKVKNKPNKEELKNLIRNTPFTIIGKTYNVSDNSIRKWCKIYSLPSTKKEINSYSNEDWDLI